MASLTRWIWVWVNSGSWWWTGRPGVLQFMGLQRARHDWVTELNWTDERGGGTLGTTSSMSFRRNTRCLHCRDPPNLSDWWQHFIFFNLNLFILIRVYPHIPSDEKNNSNISWKDSLWAPHFGHCQKILYFEQYYHPSKNLVESVCWEPFQAAATCISTKRLDTLTYWRACGKLELGTALYQRTGWVPEIWTSHDVKRETTT